MSIGRYSQTWFAIPYDSTSTIVSLPSWAITIRDYVLKFFASWLEIQKSQINKFHNLAYTEGKARCCCWAAVHLPNPFHLYLIFIFVIHHSNQRIEDSMASISDRPASLAKSIGERLSGS